jgi:hypothetical protein
VSASEDGLHKEQCLRAFPESSVIAKNTDMAPSPSDSSSKKIQQFDERGRCYG